jgi:twitching motility protein PilI
VVDAAANVSKSTAASERLVALLKSIEARCLSHAVGLPKQAAPEKNWDGVIFQIAGRCFAAPMSDVSEILNHPAAVTKVPGTKPWIVGIANVRGNLLPIVDLQAFLLKKQTMRGRRSRVLVVNYEGLYSGLLVDPFVTIRRFYLSERLSQPTGPQIAESIERYVDDIYMPVRTVREIGEGDTNSFDPSRKNVSRGNMTLSEHPETSNQNCGAIPVPIFSLRRLTTSPEFGSAAI